MKKYIVILIQLVIISSCSFQKDKIGHVVVTKLIEEYDGVKELKTRHLSELMIKKKLVDSLSVVLNTDLPKTDSLTRLRVKFQLNEQQEWLYQNSEFSKSRLFQGVIAQINSGVNKYGEANGYAYIIGASLDGTMIYGNPENDITDEVLNYLNSSYK